MRSLFGTARGSNPGPFDPKSDTNHYSTTAPDYSRTMVKCGKLVNGNLLTFVWKEG